jgi:hypothetical protein
MERRGHMVMAMADATRGFRRWLGQCGGANAEVQATRGFRTQETVEPMWGLRQCRDRGNAGIEATGG